MKTAKNFEELTAMIMDIEAPEVNHVDNGIGNYEYWGSKGVHHDYDWEVEGDMLQIQIDFEDPEDELEYVVSDTVYEAQYALWKSLNKYQENVDFSDIVVLNYELENNILTLEWVRN